MQRSLVYLVLLSCLIGCDTVPTLREPMLQIAPYLSEYRLRGTTTMDTGFGSAAVRNTPQDLGTFGVGSHEDDFGIRGEVGDGFAGLRLDYYRMSAGASRREPLTSGWGQLAQDDLASMSTVMDEFRLGFAPEVLNQKFDFRQLENVQFRLAPAVIVAHRAMSLRANEFTKTRSQNLHATDHGVLYGGLRARLQYRNIALDVEYAYKPHGFDLGGDFKAPQQDLEVRLSYEFELHGIEAFVGFRRSELHVFGHEDDQEYSGDFVLDGLQLGVRMEF